MSCANIIRQTFGPDGKYAARLQDTSLNLTEWLNGAKKTDKYVLQIFVYIYLFDVRANIKLNLTKNDALATEAIGSTLITFSCLTCYRLHWAQFESCSTAGHPILNTKMQSIKWTKRIGLSMYLAQIVNMVK